MLSSTVATLKSTEPEVGTITVLAPSPVDTKLPVCETVRLTVRVEAGAGDALTLKAAGLPSLTDDPPLRAMLTTGVVAGGGVPPVFAVPLIAIFIFPASVASLQLPVPCFSCLLLPMLQPLALPESSPSLCVRVKRVWPDPLVISKTTA